MAVYCPICDSEDCRCDPEEHPVSNPPTTPAHLHTPTRDDLWLVCERLALEPRILDRFSRDLTRSGVVGERKAARTTYLVINSRHLAQPTSEAVKGPSGGGKSHLVKSVSAFFPAEAVYELSAMSERALVYSKEPLAHRMLVVYEAAGLHSEFASYLVRSLLSEGRIRYETVMRTKEGLVPKLIEREGPTGLIVTTTLPRLHAENETRLLSLVVDDGKAHTAAVMAAIAEDAPDAIDFTQWHALQRWIATGSNKVVVPYASTLATLIPPLAVRLRRDFGALLNLIRSHALLHQATRGRDDRERIIATLDDYQVVADLVGDLVAESVEATVPQTVRETVAAVTTLLGGDPEATVNVAQVARKLDLDRSTVQRRVYVAIDRGYLVNLEDRPRRTARLKAGDPLPEEQQILPTREQVEGGVQVCTPDEGEIEEAKPEEVTEEAAFSTPLESPDQDETALRLVRDVLHAEVVEEIPREEDEQ